MEKSGYRQFTAIWLTSVAMLVLGLLAFHWYMEREEFVETMHAEAAIVGSNAGAALVFNDERAAAEILAGLEYSPNMLEAALYRNDGSLLARFRSSRTGAAAALDSRAPALGSELSLRGLQAALPVLLDNRQVGTLALRMSLDRLNGELLTFLAGYLLIAGIVTALAYLATRRLRRRLRKYQGDLEESHARLRQMIVHREDLLETEHKRIAMEIHDELGQILTAALMNLRLVKRGLGHDDVAQLIDETQAQLDAAYHGMKNIASSLHPAVLQFGFVPAVEWLAERTLRPAGLHWQIDAETPPPLDSHQSMALFRIAQESLTNVVRHANAANVRICLRKTEGTLVLEVADDGGGLPPAADANTMKFGLTGMRERAESIGAHVTIDGDIPGRGTCVRVVMPLVSPELPPVGKGMSDK